jgi:hypothetical protein
MRIDLRKLAAIDIALLGYKVIVAEYLCGVVLCVAMGGLVLAKRTSVWQLALGLYLIGIGANYVPMLWFAIAIGSRERARTEISDELGDSRAAMGKYRKASLVLLVPLAALILAVRKT